MKLLFLIFNLILFHVSPAQKYFWGICEIDSQIKLVKKYESFNDTINEAEINSLGLNSKNHIAFCFKNNFSPDSVLLFLGKLEKYFDFSQQFNLIIDIDDIDHFVTNLNHLGDGTIYSLKISKKDIVVQNSIPILNHKLTGLFKSVVSNGYDITWNIYSSFNDNQRDGATITFLNHKLSSVYLYEKENLVYKLTYDVNGNKTSELNNGIFKRW